MWQKHTWCCCPAQYPGYLIWQPALACRQQIRHCGAIAYLDRPSSSKTAAIMCSQDYLFQYSAAIEAVTPADVLAAARRHLHMEQQTAVVIADAR